MTKELLAASVTDGFLPSDVVPRYHFGDSPLQNAEAERMISHLLLAFRELGNTWGPITTDQYEAAAKRGLSDFEIDGLNRLVEAGWIIREDSRLTPTDIFVDYVRRADLRQPEVRARRDQAAAEWKAYAAEREPEVRRRTDAALAAIDSYTCVDQFTDGNDVIFQARCFRLSISRPTEH